MWRKNWLLALFFLVLFSLGALVLGGCAETLPSVPQSVSVEDGTLYHPYVIDGPPGAYLEVWNVTSQAGHDQWLVNPVYVVQVKPAMYIMHGTSEYQVVGIDQKHHRLSAVILGN